MNKFTFGSLFSGIGGLDLGLERAGMRCIWQVEIDDYCRRVLAKHWPKVDRWNDVKTFPPDPPATANFMFMPDLICGGFPCQSFSLAGLRKGENDERWLWPEFSRIIRLFRPRYVLLENVPGLLSIGAGRVFRDLAAIGYDAEWFCLPAWPVGAPYIRERLFIVGWLARNAANNDGISGRKERGGLRQEVSGRRMSGTRPTDLRDTVPIQRKFSNQTIDKSDWWATEPDMVRVVSGFPGRMDRIRGLGNCVIPQVAEWIGRRIIECHAE